MGAARMGADHAGAMRRGLRLATRTSPKFWLSRCRGTAAAEGAQQEERRARDARPGRPGADHPGGAAAPGAGGHLHPGPVCGRRRGGGLHQCGAARRGRCRRAWHRPGLHTHLLQRPVSKAGFASRTLPARMLQACISSFRRETPTISMWAWGFADIVSRGQR